MMILLFFLWFALLHRGSKFYSFRIRTCKVQNSFAVRKLFICYMLSVSVVVVLRTLLCFVFRKVTVVPSI